MEKRSWIIRFQVTVRSPLYEAVVHVTVDSSQLLVRKQRGIEGHDASGVGAMSSVRVLYLLVIPHVAQVMKKTDDSDTVSKTFGNGIRAQVFDNLTGNPESPKAMIDRASRLPVVAAASSFKVATCIDVLNELFHAIAADCTQFLGKDLLVLIKFLSGH